MVAVSINGQGAEYDVAWGRVRRPRPTWAPYEHRPELAPRPTCASCSTRSTASASSSAGATSWLRCIAAVPSRVLERVDLAASLEAGALAALLCVEAEPRACDRSLIADRLATELAVEVLHVRRPYDGGRRLRA
jgi:hypothetical protein